MKRTIKEWEEYDERRFQSQRKLMEIKRYLRGTTAWGDLSPKQAFYLLCEALESYDDFKLNDKEMERIFEKGEYFKKATTEKMEVA